MSNKLQKGNSSHPSSGDIEQSDGFYDDLVDYVRSLRLVGSYLDLGCRGGNFSILCASLCSAGVVYSVDDASYEGLISSKLDKTSVADRVAFHPIDFQCDLTLLKGLVESIPRLSVVKISHTKYLDAVLASIESVVKESTPVIFIEMREDEFMRGVSGFAARVNYTSTGREFCNGSYCEMINRSSLHKRYFDISSYWEDRYVKNGTSGCGSYGRLARFKAKFVNEFVRTHSVQLVAELGCGDGAQLALAEYPSYVGFDISERAIQACRELYLGDATKGFYIYDPIDFDSSRYKSDLAISLDVIYHLSDDIVYQKYLTHLFGLAQKYVILYTNLEDVCPSSVNEEAGYMRFRDTLTDIRNQFSEWQLINATPNQHPFNPSLPNTTSFSDFFVFEKNPVARSVVRIDDSFFNRKSHFQLFVNAEQTDLVFKELKSERVELGGLERRFDSLNGKIDSLAENLPRLEAKCDGLQKELVDLYQDRSRLERELADTAASLSRAEEAQKRLRSSVAYQVGVHLRKSTKSFSHFVRLPLALFRIYRRHLLNKNEKKLDVPKNKEPTVNSLVELDLVDEMVAEDISNRFEGVAYILYANITLNVIDGSSVWLASTVEMLSCSGKVLLLLKEAISSPHLVDRIKGKSDVIVVSPSDFGYKGQIGEKEAVEVVRRLDRVLPNIQRVVSRGLLASVLLHETRQFRCRSLVYLTDFYSYSGPQVSISDEQKLAVRLLAAQADCFLIQTPEIGDWIKWIAQSDVRFFELPPLLPDIEYTPPRALARNSLNIVYAGKITPSWGVTELLDWVEAIRAEGLKVNVVVIANKFSGAGAEGVAFRKIILARFRRLKVNHVEGATRGKVLSLYKQAHYVWCYRPAQLENSVVELSTKLVEAVASGARALVYPSQINKNLLGEDYPYFVSNYGDFSCLIKSKKDVNTSALAKAVQNRHSLQQNAGRVGRNFLTKFKSSPKILFAGHDMKFIDPYISWLKAKGYAVKVDLWAWGAAIDEARSEMLYQWADIIFCEWGLANAVWYSKRNIDGKPLYIRMHLQEVNARAKKFGYKIFIDSVSSVLFVSRSVQEKAINMFGWPESKTEYIPNFVLNDEYDIGRESGRSDLVRLGIVGIIPQRKRLDRAIALLKLLLEDGVDAELKIKGDRPENLDYMHAPGRRQELEYYEGVYREIEDNSDLSRRVTFYPWGNDMAVWYQGVDVILSPSDFESFHYSVADGVLSGCYPVIWPWEEAEAIYTEQWIVCDLAEAKKRILNYLKCTKEEKRCIQTENRRMIVDRYGYAEIYEKLAQRLGLCD